MQFSSDTFFSHSHTSETFEMATIIFSASPCVYDTCKLNLQSPLSSFFWYYLTLVKHPCAIAMYTRQFLSTQRRKFRANFCRSPINCTCITGMCVCVCVCATKNPARLPRASLRLIRYSFAALLCTYRSHCRSFATFPSSPH